MGVNTDDVKAVTLRATPEQFFSAGFSNPDSKPFFAFCITAIILGVIILAIALKR